MYISRSQIDHSRVLHDSCRKSGSKIMLSRSLTSLQAIWQCVWREGGHGGRELPTVESGGANWAQYCAVATSLGKSIAPAHPRTCLNPGAGDTHQGWSGSANH